MDGRRVSDSAAEYSELALPNDANVLGTLLGGKIMHLVDLAGAIAAVRHCRNPVVTASVDHMDFFHPVKIGQWVRLRSSVNRAFRTSMEVGVKVWVEDLIQGSQQHVVAEWFAHIAGIKLTQIAYRGGASAVNDLIAGHVKIGLLGSTPLIPHYKSGALRLLAQSTATRSPSLPEVPTFQEAGIQGLVLDQWLGVFVPAGTPSAIVATLNIGINKAVADAAVRESFLKQAQEPVGGTAEQFLQLFRSDYSKYERLMKELNIKVE